MRSPQPSYIAFIVIAAFFGLLVWIDSPSVYTQDEPGVLHQLTSQHRGVASSHPTGFTELKGAIYFGLASSKGGLWKTDGTAQGTVLVKDIAVAPTSLQRIGEQLYFVVADGAFHSALWKSDGTPEGTVLIKSDFSIYYYEFVAMGHHIYFTAFDPTHGAELWQSDGTPEGTTLLADLIPGEKSAYPRELVVSNNRLYFRGYDEQNNSTLWQSDGTTAGTQLVAGAPPGIEALTVLQNTLYFIGYTATTGEELWRYAPGDQAPSLVLDIAPGPSSAVVGRLLAIQDQLLFAANDLTHGLELWQSNGTAAGTQLVKDIAPGASGAGVDHLTVVNDLVYFTVILQTTGSELWKSDGTAAGTLRVKQMVSGTSSLYPYGLTAMNGQLYFVTSAPSATLNLWRSDGTAAGTLTFATVPSDLYYGDILTAIGNRLYFSARDEQHGGELWVSDGTSAGTVFVADLDTNYIGPDFNRFTQVNQRLYFTTFSGDPLFGGPDQLWMSKGGAAQAVLLADQLRSYGLQSVGDNLYISNYSENGGALWKHSDATGALQLVKRFARQPLQNIVPVNNQLFFLASDDNSLPSPLYDLWRSDGTPEGTIKLITGTVTAPAPTPRLAFNGRVFATRNNEIWLLDGTPTGITHFAPAGLQGYIHEVVSMPDGIYFTTAQVTDLFTEVHTMWRSDGTAQGTRQLFFTPEVTFISQLVPADHALYLIASITGRGTELWYKDGASPTFKRLVGLTSARYYANFSWLTLAHGQLFFTADDNIHGPELWKSNGTPEGTVLVKDIIPAELAGVPAAYPGPLFEFGDLLYFGANDGLHGQELWRSDGTTEGTLLFKDINPSAGSSSPANFMGHIGLFFFAADDGVHGRELWQSDGTDTGTRLVTDLYAGTGSAFPNGRALFGDILYFTGDNGLDGQQLFALQTGIPLAIPVAEEPPAPHHLYLPIVK